MLDVEGPSLRQSQTANEEEDGGLEVEEAGQSHTRSEEPWTCRVVMMLVVVVVEWWWCWQKAEPTRPGRSPFVGGERLAPDSLSAWAD